MEIIKILYAYSIICRAFYDKNEHYLKKTKGTNVFHKYAMHFALPERLT